MKIIILSAIISSAISALIINCGEGIAFWISDRFDDLKEWITGKIKK